jgi:ABC-type polysaccharide/polyol phosphate export permease
VYINDLSNIWPILTRLLWFMTPIFYSASEIGIMHTINTYNPIYYMIKISRELIIYNRFPPINDILILSLSSLLVFSIGLFIFEKNKSKLAERI